MVAIRVRHPKGVATLEVEPETQTVDDLRTLLFSITEIPPAEQELKYGYPPKPLPLSDQPLASIPIARGEQIIVTINSNPGAMNSTQVSSSSAQTPLSTTPAPSIKALNQAISAPSPLAPQTASSSRQRAESPLAESDIPVETTDSVAVPGRDAGYLQLRVVPDDNSCLFSAIGIIFEGGMGAAQSLRKVVADAIRSDLVSYPDVVLGQPREQYISKIQDPKTWGGAIELSIFSKHYKTEISSFDVATGRCDRFGQDEYESRCILVYSGIHYDALTLSPLPVSPPSFHTTIFPVVDQTILPTAETLIGQLRARHYYTDTSNFDLKCGVCGEGLIGEKGAREHAKKTGHVDFGEY